MMLSFADASDLLRTKGDRLTALLLAHSQARLGTYLSIARAIMERGNIALIATSPEVTPSSAELAGYENVPMAHLDIKQIWSLSGVDVIFAPEAVVNLPPGPATVAIPHSLPDSGLKKAVVFHNANRWLQMNPIMIRNFDYLAVAIRQHKDWVSENYSIPDVYPAEMIPHRMPEMAIVPAGYPKLDYSRGLLAGNVHRDCIMYSPTANEAAYGRVRRDGEQILKTLLEEYRHHRIVFRPYPADDDVALARDLMTRIDHPRLVLDTSTTGVQYQRQCAVIVTDSSSSALTFSISSGRPLVSVDLRPGSARTSVDEMRKALGFAVWSPTEMTDCINHALANEDAWKADIEKAARKSLYNYDSASAYLAKHLPTFARKRIAEVWLKVERRAWDPAQRPREEHIAYLRRLASELGSRGARLMASEVEAFLMSPYGKSASAVS